MNLSVLFAVVAIVLLIVAAIPGTGRIRWEMLAAACLVVAVLTRSVTVT